MAKKIIDINYRNEMSIEEIIEDFLHTICNLQYILFISFSFSNTSLYYRVHTYFIIINTSFIRNTRVLAGISNDTN